MSKQEEARQPAGTRRDSLVFPTGEEASRMCCSMIETLPEADELRRRMTALISAIGVCIQNGIPDAERRCLQLRLQELLAEYYRRMDFALID